MNQEEYEVARLLIVNPRMIYVTKDGFRAYACAYGRLALITGRNFNNMSEAQIREYVDNTIKLYTMNWGPAKRKASNG